MTAATNEEGSTTKRLKGVSYERPIVYGSVATWLGKKADQLHTHRWTCYVRGPSNENLGYFIKKVVFVLHESFQNPKRTVTKPPFEVTETGWGEFEIVIRIYFVDPTEQPAELYHFLKLYPPEGEALSTKKPVVSEQYDEIVFTNPTEYFYNILIKNHPAKSPKIQAHRLADHHSIPTEQKELQTIQRAQQKVRADIRQLKEQYDVCEKEAEQLRTEIEKLQKELHFAPTT